MVGQAASSMTRTINPEGTRTRNSEESRKGESVVENETV